MAKAPEPSLDVLELLPDGRVRLAWDGFDVTLRRPKVKEWLSYLEEGEAADAWNATNEDGSTRPRLMTELLGEDGPYQGLYAHVIEELAGVTVARADVPIWMVDGKLLGKLNAHWMNLPLASSG